MLDRLFEFLSATGFRWVDVLDILLVAFIVYELLRFIRGTHAVQIALGGMVLVALYWISTLFNLQTVNWLLRTFLPFLVFGVIVIFQSESRKALAHLGRTPFLGAAAKRQKTEVVDEVVLAATTLSSQRTGAIVALEREPGLRTVLLEIVQGASTSASYAVPPMLRGRVREALEGTLALVESRALAQDHIDRAVSSVDGLPETPATAALIAVARSTLFRSS